MEENKGPYEISDGPAYLSKTINNKHGCLLLAMILLRCYVKVIRSRNKVAIAEKWYHKQSARLILIITDNLGASFLPELTIYIYILFLLLFYLKA